MLIPDQQPRKSNKTKTEDVMLNLSSEDNNDAISKEVLTKEAKDLRHTVNLITSNDLI